MLVWHLLQCPNWLDTRDEAIINTRDKVWVRFYIGLGFWHSGKLVWWKQSLGCAQIDMCIDTYGDETSSPWIFFISASIMILQIELAKKLLFHRSLRLRISAVCCLKVGKFYWWREWAGFNLKFKEASSAWYRNRSEIDNYLYRINHRNSKSRND